MRKTVISGCFAVGMFLFLANFQSAYALSPGPRVLCCSQQKNNVGLTRECSKLDLGNCDEILKDWERAQENWLKTPVCLQPKFIIGLVIALTVIVLSAIQNRMKRLLAILVISILHLTLAPIVLGVAGMIVVNLLPSSTGLRAFPIVFLFFVLMTFLSILASSAIALRFFLDDKSVKSLVLTSFCVVVIVASVAFLLFF